MNATMTDGQASNLRPLPERTTAPVRHAERLEFLSKDWVDAVRAYLTPRVAERRNALVGKRAAVCEMFTDAPGHLGYEDNVAAFHIAIDDGELNVAPGAIDDADYRMQADYNQAHIVATAVFEDHPERQARLTNEAMHRHGAFFQTQGGLDKAPAALLEAMAGMHDHLGKRTVANPDTEHRIDRLGMRRHVEEIEERGYTVVENAISDELCAELSEDLRRLIVETGRGRVASMLLARGLLWEELAMHPWIHSLAQHMLGADCNMGQSLGFIKRNGEDTHRLHNDPPHPLTGDKCCNVTTIWALDDFTDTSGSTVVVPGSHKWHRPPDPDAMARAEKILMPRGSVALWHGSLWHGSAIREDEGERLTIHNTYLRNWVRTFDSYLEIDPAILERNPPTFTTLCGVDDLYGKNTYAGPDFSRMA